MQCFSFHGASVQEVIWDSLRTRYQITLTPIVRKIFLYQRCLCWGESLSKAGKNFNTSLAFPNHPFIFIYLFIFLFVVDVVIHWNETAMGLHVFPIPIPPPTTRSTRSLQVFPLHQVRALVSCIQPGLVIRSTLDNIHVSMLFNHPFKKGRASLSTET